MLYVKLLLLHHGPMVRACLWQTLVPTCMNGCPHINKPELQLLSYVLFVVVPWALGGFHIQPRSTYKVVQCTSIHHDNCCHPLDKKSPVPVNHGRPSKSNAGDILCICQKVKQLNYALVLYYTSTCNLNLLSIFTRYNLW